ncbi:hypothetical protein [Ponticoccus litoralis]|uniref:Tetratricopeptide repeat protein n=1 Tax=Ponticoccus litoralis TaxID=422297 RepID=A0AAW9SJR3_9RHOB
MGLCISVVQAEETRLSLDEARGAAAGFLADGRPEAALILADGALLGAPDHPQTLMLRARALRDLGRDAEAVKAARAALGGGLDTAGPLLRRDDPGADAVVQGGSGHRAILAAPGCADCPG